MTTETFSIERLSEFTGEPVERMREWRDAGLIGGSGEEFSDADIEKIRLLQLLLRRGIPLDAIAEAERRRSLLTERVAMMFPNGVGRRYSFAEAASETRASEEFVRRFWEAAHLIDQGEQLYEEDVEVLRPLVGLIAAGFPEEALLEVARVSADATERVAEAGGLAFHFYVHERNRAAGLPAEADLSVAEQATPLVEPSLLYAFRKAQQRFNRDDLVLHAAEEAGLSQPADVPGQLDRAVAFVDLSSFTPMTEAMGDPEAAAVLERFSQIVRTACVRNDGRVVKQAGDGFMLVFADAASATVCALDIVDGAAREPRFPAARVGVHWGQVLYREGDYVGSNVNLASRVATSAERHQVLLTEAARDQSKTLVDVSFSRLGKHRMKGLPEEAVLFEAQRESSQRRDRLVDPVCGMEMGPAEVAARLTLDGREQAFCSDDCLKLYVAAPERYG